MKNLLTEIRDLPLLNTLYCRENNKLELIQNLPNLTTFVTDKDNIRFINIRRVKNQYYTLLRSFKEYI